METRFDILRKLRSTDNKRVLLAIEDLRVRGWLFDGSLGNREFCHAQMQNADLMGANLTNRAIQLLAERYEPGAGTGKHALTHVGEECGIILKGRLEVTVGEETLVLGEGDAYYFDSSRPHFFRNIGNIPCEVITACTPPSF